MPGIAQRGVEVLKPKFLVYRHGLPELRQGFNIYLCITAFPGKLQGFFDEELPQPYTARLGHQVHLYQLTGAFGQPIGRIDACTACDLIIQQGDIIAAAGLPEQFVEGISSGISKYGAGTVSAKFF